MWSRPEIVVMITLGREKLVQHMLLGVHDLASDECRNYLGTELLGEPECVSDLGITIVRI